MSGALPNIKGNDSYKNITFGVCVYTCNMHVGAYGGWKGGGGGGGMKREYIGSMGICTEKSLQKTVFSKESIQKDPIFAI